MQGKQDIPEEPSVEHLFKALDAMSEALITGDADAVQRGEEARRKLKKMIETQIFVEKVCECIQLRFKEMMASD